MIYEHPQCTAKGMIDSARLGENISGHDFIQVAGNHPFNAILCCQVCGIMSNGDFDEESEE